MSLFKLIALSAVVAAVAANPVEEDSQVGLEEAPEPEPFGGDIEPFGGQHAFDEDLVDEDPLAQEYTDSEEEFGDLTDGEFGDQDMYEDYEAMPEQSPLVDIYDLYDMSAMTTPVFDVDNEQYWVQSATDVEDMAITTSPGETVNNEQYWIRPDTAEAVPVETEEVL